MATVALLLVALVAVAQVLYFWPKLPAQAASQFGAGGQVTSRMPKSSLCVMMLVMNVGLPLFLLAIANGIRHLPTSLVNIPNREFWFHPDRREATFRDVEASLVWISLLTAVFLLGVSQLSFLANIHDSPLATLPFSILLGLFLVGVGGVCAWSLRRFRLPPEN